MTTRRAFLGASALGGAALLLDVGRDAVAAAPATSFKPNAWLRVGRDPRRGTVIPLFAPPDGMSAAAVRYVSRSCCVLETGRALLRWGLLALLLGAWMNGLPFFSRRVKMPEINRER